MGRTQAHITWAWIAFTVFARPAVAQFGVPTGPEFRVDSTLGGVLGDGPSVGMSSDGRLFVVWTGVAGDADGPGITGRRFAASGLPEAGEFRVNTTVVGDQSHPVVATNSAGASVVVWQSFGQDGSGWGIYGQRYDATGAPSGGEFRVNTTTLGDQEGPAIGIDGVGRFVVCWRAPITGGGSAMFGQRFDSVGAQVGPEFEIGAASTGFTRGSVAMSAAGNFVVAWSNGTAHARGYDTTGAPNGSAIDIWPGAFAPSVGIDDNARFVVVVPDLVAGPTQAFFYNAAGGKQDTLALPHEFMLNPGVVTNPGGEVLVFGVGIAEREVAGGFTNGISAQAFGPAANSLTTIFPVNTFAAAEGYYPAAAVGAPGLSALVWQHTVGAVVEVHGQRFGPPSPLAFHTLPPCRVIDTRGPAGPLSGPGLTAGGARSFRVAGVCGIPSSAKALATNLVVTEPVSAGYLTFVPWIPAAGELPSFLNYVPGQTRSNTAIVSLSPGNELVVRCAQSSGSAHFILDVVGYFE